MKRYITADTILNEVDRDVKVLTDDDVTITLPYLNLEPTESFSITITNKGKGTVTIEPPEGGTISQKEQIWANYTE